MTHDVQSIRDDLAFMRALAQEGRRAPLLIGRNLMVAGIVYGTACLFAWGVATQLLAAPRWWEGAIWFPVTLVYVPYAYLRRTQSVCIKPGASALTNRAVNAAWRGVGYAVIVLGVATSIAAYQTRSQAEFGLFPSMIMALYGLGWLVAAAMSETRWLRTIAIASFVVAILSAFVADSKAGYLVTAAALYILMALPGWLLTRAEPSDVV